LLAKVLKRDIDAVADLPECALRQRDAGRLGQRFHPRSDIDVVSIKVAILVDDLPNVCTDAKAERLTLAGEHLVLPGDRAFYEIDGAGKFGQVSVAHALEDPPVMLCDSRFDDLRLTGLEGSQRPSLVLAHEARIADHIGSEYGGESAFHC
jgi:hypothetical protein